MLAKHHCNKKLLGFTLIELIVVVAIMAVLGVIFTDILIQSIRGQNKVKVINMVKQNGQVVMDKLSNEIRQAEDLVCVGKIGLTSVDCQTTACDTIVTYKGGTYSRYRLVAPSPPTNPTVNGKITRNDFTKDLIPIGGENTLCKDADISNTLLTNLSDTNTISGVSLDYMKDGTNPKPVFNKTVSSEVGFGETIIIQFNAVAGVGAGYNFDVTVKEGGVPFTTAVNIRGGQR